MKKVIALFSIAACLSATSAMAQPGGGMQMSPEQRAAMMKERVAGLNLGLSPALTDSVVAVWNDRDLQQAVFGGANFMDMSPEDRQAKNAQLNEARAKRLAKAGLTDEQIKKVVEGLSMRRGPGGPGGGRGNK